jgi:type 1 fimbria pilin
MLRIGSAAAAAAALLVVLAAGATGAGQAKTVRFSGRIVSSGGRYAALRGNVRLVMTSSSGTGSQAPAPTTIAFTVTLSGPACHTQVVKAQHRCVSLHGTLRGDAKAAPQRIPDVGREFALGADGRVKPLGKVVATGTTSSLGFVATGRFPLTLQLSGPAGQVTIDAQGPVVKGFSSPF